MNLTLSEPRTAVVWFEALRRADVPLVGGKNASLGELIRSLKPAGIHVPDGFATTAQAFRHFLQHNDLEDHIRSQLSRIGSSEASLHEAGQSIRDAIVHASIPEAISKTISDAYGELCRRYKERNVDVAVRSSATAEDLPEASFAGQQESFLNIRGIDALLDACRACFASLYTDRAISYRAQQGFQDVEVALSVGVQKMVRSDRGCAGVLFTIDTETGFPDEIIINASWGLGESVVKGLVTPDEYRVFKPLLGHAELWPILARTVGDKATKLTYNRRGQTPPTRTVKVPAVQRHALTLTDEEVMQLSRWGTAIEAHYQRPMDVEWAKDGLTGELFVVQARPETVQSRRKAASLKTYTLKEKGAVLTQGLAVGSAIAGGKAYVIRSIDEAARFESDGILIASKTDPDWVPLMKRAAGIVTDQGGRTSHAAIVSRELGVPAVIGTSDATTKIASEQMITISCAEGEHGVVYEGRLAYEEAEVDLSQLPATRTHIMVNLADPEGAMRWWSLPVDGVGLARMEFIINNAIKVHPLALVRFDKLEDRRARREIEKLTAHYPDKGEYFVERLACGIATIAASQYLRPVIVRLSDFKTNEYANLIGGRQFEPHEDNPMLGFRGASRYYSDRYRDGFELECRALKRVREKMGLTNIVPMIPFCRTPEEADRVLEVMAGYGLKRGESGLEIYVMAEIPSNVVLAADFAQRFDGFSIGSNDLTQLMLGVDRDSALLANIFDERHPAVTTVIRQLIETAHQHGAHVGICGQAPSDHPGFAEFLVEAGIDSISVNPDSVIHVRRRVAECEAKRGMAVSA